MTPQQHLLRDSVRVAVEGLAAIAQLPQPEAFGWVVHLPGASA